MSRGLPPRVCLKIGVVSADGRTCVKVAYQSAFLSERISFCVLVSYMYTCTFIPLPSCGLDDRSPRT